MTITQDRARCSARTSADDVLFVPCRRITGLGTDVLVTGHLPDGTRTGIAFTSTAGVSRAMGASQTWVRLSHGGLRSMLRAMAVAHLQVDPDLVAPNPHVVPGERLQHPAETSAPAAVAADVPAEAAADVPAGMPADPRAGERLRSGATA